jgi:NTE family protein
MAITVVLSAGGARGFAHLGVIRALREAHVPIDLIGGCSMGSIVGAAVALEWDDAEIKERLRHSFVNTNPVNDYTLPFLSLIKGRRSHACSNKILAAFASRNCGVPSSVFQQT